MLKEFGQKSPRAASFLIWLVGYLSGTAISLLFRLIWWRTLDGGHTLALGFISGSLLLVWAQHAGWVQREEEIAQPISLFGRDGFHSADPKR